MNIGRLGVSTFLDTWPADECVDAARKIETWGYSTLWLPEALGRDAFGMLGYLGHHTQELRLATGIATIYGRDPVTMQAIHQTYSELLPGRFVLGLGVSHSHLVSNIRGHTYKPPVTAMRDYVTAMRSALYQGAPPKEQGPVVLAALRPRMLELAAEIGDGAHTYFAPTQHTERARDVVGSNLWIGVGQFVLLEEDGDVARNMARPHIAIYLTLPAYRENLKWMGFSDSDLDDGGSDALIDAIVAWGDRDTIARRIEAQFAAGADHVCIQPLRTDGKAGPDLRALEALAPQKAGGTES